MSTPPNSTSPSLTGSGIPGEEWPRHPDLAEHVRTAVEEAGEAVLQDPAQWRWHALNPEEAEQTVAHIVDVVTGPATDARTSIAESDAVLSLTLRLIDLLRQELLRNPPGISDPVLLDVIRRLETCRADLEPRARQDLAYLLTGANSLELVVEFAHDLRSPLTSIMFLAETLRKGQSGEINDVQRDQLGIVYSAALGIIGMANDLMDLASSEADDDWGDFAEESFSIREIVETVRNTVAPMAEQKRLAVSFYTPHHDQRVGHPILLNRVLLNLVTNAIKFTEEGRVEIVAEETGPGQVEFTVQDTGRGISPEAQDSVFSLFGRSQSRTGYHFSGTGLGLTICKRMVSMMGGELHVESQVGEGTRFYFELELPRA